MAWILLLGGVLVVAATVVSHQAYRSGALPNHLHMVKRHVLYRSAQPEGKRQWAFLRRHGIKTVVDLRVEDEDRSAFQQEQRACDAAGAQMVLLPVCTTLPSDEQVLRFLQAVKRAGPVLVHCQHGRGRTGVMVAAYRVILGGASALQAERDMLRHGWAPAEDDSLGQVRQFLARLERDRPQWRTAVNSPAQSPS